MNSWIRRKKEMERLGMNKEQYNEFKKQATVTNELQQQAEKVSKKRKCCGK